VWMVVVTRLGFDIFRRRGGTPCRGLSHRADRLRGGLDHNIIRGGRMPHERRIRGSSEPPFSRSWPPGKAWLMIEFGGKGACVEDEASFQGQGCCSAGFSGVL